ncbi:MAG TPA: helix-turn-helix domain-containing protein, partial [Polyangiales bacterium]|nr:helix-turn-helix domain-containing protein [Polyangiales bacterium]
NRDLRERVSEGRFREDLFYRLNVVQLDVPPLRVRKSDIPALAHHFLRRFAQENGREIRDFSNDALKALLAYPWPGNVRELENAIERAVVMCNGELLEAEQLPGHSGQAALEMGVLVPGITLDELERMAIMQALEAASGSTAQAAEMLGVSRRKIQYRLKEWGLTGVWSQEGEAAD